MATYKALRGVTIPTVAGDPSNMAVGDIWYSSTTKKIRIAKTTAAAWSSGGNLNQARMTMGSAGDKTAGLGFGGYVGPFSALSETYDGTSWTEGGNVNLARDRGPGLGTSTAALYVGGRPATADAEEYNGTSWSEVTNMPASQGNLTGTGTQTAGLISGGGLTVAGNTDATLEYDGSSWTAGGDLNVARGGGVAAGTQTAALHIGANYSPAPIESGAEGYTAYVEQYDGSSWTEVGDLLVSRGTAAASGTTSDSLVWGGETGPAPAGVATSNRWDGSAWASAADIPQVTNKAGGSGATVDSTLGMGGYRPGGNPLNATIEFTDAYAVAATVTSS